MKMNRYETHLYTNSKDRQNDSTPRSKTKIITMNRHERYLYFLVFCLFVLMLTFQNCDSKPNLTPTVTDDSLCCRRCICTGFCQ